MLYGCKVRVFLAKKQTFQHKNYDIANKKASLTLNYYQLMKYHGHTTEKGSPHGLPFSQVLQFRIIRWWLRLLPPRQELLRVPRQLREPRQQE